MEDMLTSYDDEDAEFFGKIETGTLVAYLHYYTSKIIAQIDEGTKIQPECLVQALILVFGWLHNRGLDPIALLFEKHRYNLTRPYKHGKKF